MRQLAESYHSSIGIIGAGPAGLLVAYLLLHRGLNVEVYEASKRVGYPPHCSGIVSPETASRIGFKEAIMSVYERTVFLNVKLVELGHVEAKPLAVKLNRPLLEELIASTVEDLGGKLLTKCRVRYVEPFKSIVWSKCLGARRYESIVLADGASRSISSRVLGGKCSTCIGVEAKVTLGKRLPDDTFYTIHGDIAPDFFAWVVPVSNGREAYVGLASSSNVMERLNTLLKILDGWVGIGKVMELKSGLVVRGPAVKNPIKANTYGIGDAVCTSKPFTGGGLYAISILASKLADALAESKPSIYLEAYKRVAHELKLQRTLTEIFKVLWPLSMIALVVSLSNCKPRFDEHSDMLKCLARSIVVPRRT